MIASRQQGVVTIAQLAGIGATLQSARLLLDQGHLVRAARGTYVIAGSPATVEQSLQIAVRSRSDALVSGRTAAWIHGFEGVAKPTRPEITVPATASARNPAAAVRRSQHFANIATVDVGGIRVATVEETVFRMAEYAQPRRVARFLDASLLTNPQSADVLGEIYLRHQGERMRGMAALRPLLLERLDTGMAATESELEALADEVFADAGLPQMLRQIPIPWAPGAGRVDRYFPRWRLIVELDGRRWHARHDQFEMDRMRDNAAAANGYAVLRFTWRMLRARPDECIAVIRATGDQAERRIA